MRDERPADRPALRGLFGADEPEGPPGRGLVAVHAAEVVALLRLSGASPGDGYHSEHVRRVHLRGAGGAVASLLRACDERQPARLRLELESPLPPGLDDRTVEAAGFTLEASLPEGWRDGPRETALRLFARTAPPKPSADEPESRRPVRSPTDESERLVVHGPGTRDALGRFLEQLVPGRSYPPGTLLSEAERVETRRPGDLEARWLLALDESAEVVAGLVFEPDGRQQRAHVLRVHVDVREDRRGKGLATRLLSEARRVAGRWSAHRLEADPRGGHRAVIRALITAGFAQVGSQRGAWRMRTATRSWDEDVQLFSAPVEAADARGADDATAAPRDA